MFCRASLVYSLPECLRRVARGRNVLRSRCGCKRRHTGEIDVRHYESPRTTPVLGIVSHNACVCPDGLCFDMRSCRNLDELWPNLGDDGLREAAYRGGWKPA